MEDARRGMREAGASAQPESPALRCPRCGAWLGARASSALAEQRRAQDAGRPVAVRDDAPYCGCCGLLIATSA